MSFADRERLSIVKAEKRELGIDHCEAGGMIAESWKFTGAIADTIRYHHDLPGYMGDYGDVLRTVAVADFFANREGIGFSGNRYPDKIPPEIFELLGIQKSLLEELDEPVNAEIEKAKVFLKLGG
jgi:HD-like signal output (HDOD) protein